MSEAKGLSPVADRRRKRRKSVNFLLDEDGFHKMNRASQTQDMWECARRADQRVSRWEAFEKWQKEARRAQAKTVDGVRRLPRKLSLKAIFNSK